ncbi:putative dehydrogenase [Thermosporothrix hazakensis]|jgi:predicted dehydrogenase|uniref:Dehydrogenase n=2 Tax=Thermosporothrix TaxID=768650 RepID=A0A455SS58_9CHLR|nr:Gfo/Idh/MocA family oxidoreductase [Thermosporothrix hazakensis]PZW25654.1 putative dehydrogenase [Thermosporothrix hazakensis]BBH89951.1 dehydrogenase [Thermosporothrix sp. COM3]GCE48149.1 dehydrogenase [Thermosporothrix hazakensis]
MIRVAMISFWHVHAQDYATQAQKHPDVEIVAAWDEQPERGRQWAERLGVKFYEDLDELLSQPDIDGVIIDTPTTMHREVMLAAARAGKHIFTEKVVATTLHECNEIIQEVARAGVKLTVSLPRLYDGYTRAILGLLERNLIGEITLVRTRLSHNGAIPTEQAPNGWLPAHFFSKEQCGGGALIDLGCHPMYLARLFMGRMPESVSAHYGYVTGREVEDNAVATLHYPDGAIGVVEAGFVNRFSPFSIEIHGTEGSILYGLPERELHVRSPKIEGGKHWEVITNLPEDQPRPFAQWITHIQENTTATENIQMALDLTTLMEASNLSAQQKRPIVLDELAR